MDQVVGETDPTKAADLLNQADTIMWQDLDTIPLFQWPDIVAFRDHVQNVTYNPTSLGLTWNDQTWAVAA